MAELSDARDWEAVRGGLERWLRARRPDAENVRIGSVSTPVQGMSSDIVFLDASWSEAGVERAEELVARLPPQGPMMFPTYDLLAQAAVQRALAAAGVPVSVPLGAEEDPQWIGCSFLVMTRVEGRVPGSIPPYSESGWLVDASPELRGRVFASAIDVLADIHRADWRQMGLETLGRPGGLGLAGEIAWWSDYLDWVSNGHPPTELAELLSWCRAEMPQPEPAPALLWGDARLGNLMFDGQGSVVAVLDWEMASIGPPEVDLGWFTALQAALNPPIDRAVWDEPELLGFPSASDAVRRYEERLGRPVANLGWYQVFAMARLGACSVRTTAMLEERGIEPFWEIGPLVPKWVEMIVEGRQPGASAAARGALE